MEQPTFNWTDGKNRTTCGYHLLARWFIQRNFSYVGSGANRKLWTQEIDKSQIVMIGVQFSNGRRMRREDIEELKADTVFWIMSATPYTET